MHHQMINYWMHHHQYVLQRCVDGGTYPPRITATSITPMNNWTSVSITLGNNVPHLHPVSSLDSPKVRYLHVSWLPRIYYHRYVPWYACRHHPSWICNTTLHRNPFPVPSLVYTWLDSRIHSFPCKNRNKLQSILWTPSGTHPTSMVMSSWMTSLFDVLSMTFWSLLELLNKMSFSFWKDLCVYMWLLADLQIVTFCAINYAQSMNCETWMDW